MGLGGVRESGEPGGVLEPDSGIRALGESPAFEGPVEPQESDHVCNDHLALFYETREEQLSAIVPFVRQGLARGERCMYVTGESDEGELREALREGGVDVEAALESGALIFETVDETYLRNGSFDPEEMVAYYEREIEAATGSFSALRVTAETTWLRREGVSVEEFVAFEARINECFEREDFVALCQYDREALEPAVRRDLVRSHPHLISEGTLCHNVYYTPPPEYFGPDRAERHVEHMLGTLVERTEAKATLHERQRLLAEVAEIVGRPGGTVESTLQTLFERGCEWFDLDLGALATVDPATDRFEVEYCSDGHPRFEPGLELPLSETYCSVATDARAVASVVDPQGEGHDDLRVHEEFGLDTYCGTYVPIEGGPDRTVFFVGSDRPAEPIGETERAVLELVGQWIKCAIERRHRERYLRESYAVTSNPALGFDETLRRLLELGRERFGLELGFFARRDRDADAFEAVQAVGSNEFLSPTPVGRVSEAVCRAVAESEEPLTVRDARTETTAGDPEDREGDLAAYVGTTVDLGQEVAGSLCFCSRSARSRPYSASSLTFLELLSQWIEYELARRRREDRLGRLTELAADTERSFDGKLAALFELGCEQFDLDLGCIAELDPEAGGVDIEAVSTDHQDLRPGSHVPLSERSRRVLETGTEGDSVSVDEVFEDVLADEVEGVRSSLGTRVELAHDRDRVLCFVSTEPRRGGFSVGERTFHDLMGQWVSYELGREHRESQLAALNRMSRDLVDAETRPEIAERTVAHAAGDLQLPVTGIVTYDGESGKLRAAARTERAEEKLPLAALDDRPNGPLWEAFVSGERRRIGDLDDGEERGGDLTEVLAVPLGRQGLFVTATSAPGGFDQVRREFVETTAATVEAAYARADREQKLHQREARLEEQNDTLERLNRVNGIIRGIDQALVGAGSREGIETVVCEQLAEVGPYELAWIGDYDAVAETVRSKQVAGGDGGFLEETAAGPDEAAAAGPIGRAVATREVQVVNNVLEDSAAEPWRQSALNRGYHACVALPLSYEETCYGALVVCSDRPGVFDELERTVLAEMADTIAYAVNAVESKKAIVSDEVTRLTFDIEDADLSPVTFARRLDYEVSLESLVPGSDGEVRAFVSTTGLDPSSACQLSDELEGEDITLAAAYEEPDDPFALYEITLSDRSPISTALEHGGRPRDLTISDEEATLTIEMAADAAVREFVDMFRSAYPGTELSAQRTRERPQQTPTEFFSAIGETLTDRQLEALQLAYHSGYLEEPRLQRATDLAETMGITQPTFNSHLRAAHRKLCEQLFEGRSPTA